MTFHSLKRWILNLIKNNLWIIIIGLIMWVLSTINGLKFAEASVKNSQENLKTSLDSYTFLSGKLESFPTPSSARSLQEKTFIQLSNALKYKSVWTRDEMSAYIAQINATECFFSNPALLSDSAIKRSLFFENRPEFLINFYTYNDSTAAYNQLLSRFPDRFFAKKMGLSPYPILSVPEILTSHPVIRLSGKS